MRIKAKNPSYPLILEMNDGTSIIVSGNWVVVPKKYEDEIKKRCADVVDIEEEGSVKETVVETVENITTKVKETIKRKR